MKDSHPDPHINAVQSNVFSFNLQDSILNYTNMEMHSEAEPLVPQMSNQGSIRKKLVSCRKVCNLNIFDCFLNLISKLKQFMILQDVISSKHTLFDITVNENIENRWFMISLDTKLFVLVFISSYYSCEYCVCIPAGSLVYLFI